jgi:hypothetical protein
MGGKSGYFTIQNEVISEKQTAIKRLKRGDTQLACGVSKAEESQGQKFGPRKMYFLVQFGMVALNNPLAHSTFPKDWGLQAQWR